ncbi:hypothetical protein P9851_00050 [Geobacillus stearothermophilus]|uniref:hypothetical protein n=1 Tax=Geobacillus stearothermophilus TaxID=1422 RepID=UPI002E23D3A5|nr:hypothetical protein [Geobacillus stearothermophilus]
MAAIYVGGIFRSRESLLSRGFFFCVSSSDVVLRRSLKGGSNGKTSWKRRSFTFEGPCYFPFAFAELGGKFVFHPSLQWKNV